MNRTKLQNKLRKYLLLFRIKRYEAARYIEMSDEAIGMMLTGTMDVSEKQIQDILYCHYQKLHVILGDLEKVMDKEGVIWQEVVKQPGWVYNKR